MFLLSEVSIMESTHQPDACMQTEVPYYYGQTCSQQFLPIHFTKFIVDCGGFANIIILESFQELFEFLRNST